MSTATDELVDLDVNLDETIPCQTSDSGVPCDREAAWRGTAHPCGHGLNHCEEHYKVWREADPGYCRTGNTKRHEIDRITWRKL